MIRSQRKPDVVDVELATRAAQIVVQVHRRVVGQIRAGMTLARVDALVGEAIADLGARSCFLGYVTGDLPPFPSHACLSLNDCIVHGTADYVTRELVRGDVLKLDVGVEYEGWIGDAGWTYGIEETSELTRRMMAAGKEALERGVATLRPGNRLQHWAEAVTRCVEREHGFYVVEQLGGHGIGRTLHGGPFVSNLPAGPGVKWAEARKAILPGLLVAVEPMVAAGTRKIRHPARTWPIYTADGSLSVHYEHDVLVTESGPRVLSAGMEGLPDVLG